MTTTPPPRSIVHTPPTPLHGPRFDNHQHPTTRKSTRQATRQSQRAVHTPPPVPAHHPSTSRFVADVYSPPSSAHTSPQTRATKRRRGNPINDSPQTNTESSPGSSFGMNTSLTSNDPSFVEQRSLNPITGMLPTPAKTPRKQDLRKATELQSAARVLFPTRLDTVEDAMPTKKGRRARKSLGFSMDSSGEDQDSTSAIKIFTDSKDKVPELDVGEDNPFIEKPKTTIAPEPTKISGRRNRKSQVKTNPDIEEAFKHEEGMVYVFRGKKMYRRFTPDPDNPNQSSEETEIGGLTSPRPTRLTRSSVKPRLLFPTEKQRRERELAEEEALTEIEDDHPVGKKNEKKPITPVKQSFTAGPATPPTTGHHATRSATKQQAAMHSDGYSPFGSFSVPEVSAIEGLQSSSGERRLRKKTTSPFDAWQRTKAGSSAAGGHGKGKKRGVEQVDESAVEVGGHSKRNKSHTGI
ncbi:MAG: hypothetical protein Q9168_001708 [Polycauliona sp. 1 TL-2023]